MFGSGGFGTTTSTFGSTGFGSPANTGANVFGQPAQPQQTSSLFGSGGTAFGGAQQSSLPAFGSTTGAAQPGAFGAQTASPNVFGQQLRQNTGLFSSTGTTMSPFSAQPQAAGTSIPFNAITGTDTMMKNGAASQINTRHQCITCMKEYENKSLEELRLEDYQLNRKGPQNPMFNPGQAQATPGTSLFSGIGGGSVAGTSGTGTFGQTNTFGQSPSTSGGLFGSLSQPKPGGFFGSTTATPSTSTAFGAGSTLGGGFSFNNPTSQPQTSIFGSNNNTVTSNTGLGAQSAFSFSQPQQQQSSLSLFGPKPLTTPASSAPSFVGFGSPATNTGLNKPLFGQSTPAPAFGGASAAPTFGTGTGSLFSTNAQQSQQAKPFTFSTPFSSTAQQPASQPSFGTTSTSSFSFSNPVSTPAISFGGGTAPTFGSATGAGTSSFGSNLSFSLGSNTQPTQSAATGFGTGLFSNTNNTATGGAGTGTGLSLFGSGTTGGTNTFGSGGFGTGSFQLGQQQSLQLQQQQQQQQQLSMQSQSMISFATTPFRDSELFYNLISNRKVDEMAKPTNPMAQRRYREASRRKTSISTSPTGLCMSASSIAALASSAFNGNSGISPTIKGLSITQNTKISSISKFHVFEGFQDDDVGVGNDILSPKSNVKKLVLNTNGEVDNSPARLSASFPSIYGENGGGSGSSGLVRRASVLHANAGLASGSRGASFEPRRQEPETLARRLEFEDSVLSTESYSSLLDSSAVVGEHGDGYGNGLPSSKRASEDIGLGLSGIINGGMQNSGKDSQSQPGAICGVVCSRPGYYVKPSLSELDKLVDGNGSCIVHGLEVGRNNYGKVKFLGAVNVSGINLDEIVLFRHKEVVVYPDDENKPDHGKGLNVPAEIELERVFPMEKPSNNLIRSPERIRSLNYEQKLRKACDKLGAEFIAYNDTEGIWKFKVLHFSKYGIVDDDEEDEPTIPPKGLGGISQQNLKQQRASIAPTPGPAGDAPFMPHAIPALPHYIPTPASHHTMNLLEGTKAPQGPAPVSDVEMNPLTPCDSDDDEDDLDDDDDADEDMDDSLLIRRPSLLSNAIPCSPFASPASSGLKFKSILKDGVGDKASLMNKYMTIDEFDVEDPCELPLLESQPPSKKPKPSRVSLLLPRAEQNSMEEGHRLKERLSLVKTESGRLPQTSSLSKLPVSAVVPLEPIEHSKLGEQADLFSSMHEPGFVGTMVVRRAPRVCFTKHGHFLTINQSKDNCQGKVSVNQLSSYAEKQANAPLAASIRVVLERQMNTYMKKNDNISFLDYIGILEQEIRNCEIIPVKTMLEKELVIWELCDILWPGEERLTPEFLSDSGFQLEQRKRICHWMRKYALILFENQINTSDVSVLALLKRGQVENACLKAIQDGNEWLAILMSSDPHLLLDFSEDNSILQGMPNYIPDIFALISGNIRNLSTLTAEKVSNMTTSEYLQYFALFLWYEGPIQSELPVALDKGLRQFEHMMREVAGYSCALPSIESDTIANLAMHLLKMYCCTGYPPNVVVKPRTFTSDCFDYKLPWLLLQELELIGYLPDDDTYTSVCLGYTGMLEGIGMWKWIPVVASCLPGPDIRVLPKSSEVKLACDQFVTSLLHREVSHEFGDDETFLINTSAIDRRTLIEIAVMKARSVNRMDAVIWYLEELNEHDQAYASMQKYFKSKSPLDLIIDKSPSAAVAMRRHLQRLEDQKDKLADWDGLGKMLASYLALRDSDQMDVSVTGFLESVVKVVPGGRQECAFLLEIALSAGKLIQICLSEREVNPELKETIMDNLISFLNKAKPTEYFEGLRTFINAGITPDLVDLAMPLPRVYDPNMEQDHNPYMDMVPRLAEQVQI